MKKKLFILFPVIVFASMLRNIFLGAKTEAQMGAIQNHCSCKTPLPIITKNIKTDFGAKGNNKNNDSFSFLAAADWLNKNCSDSFILKLYIPSGTYLVGLQVAPDEIITNPLCSTQ
ncbi:MAG: hypothetical protein ABI855_13940, partial [Bacteroidota bacterium]